MIPCYLHISLRRRFTGGEILLACIHGLFHVDTSVEVQGTCVEVCGNFIQVALKSAFHRPQIKHQNGFRTKYRRHRTRRHDT
jgi:hypothetical protein